MWRFAVGRRVIFARENDGCAGALLATAARDPVAVRAQRVRGDLYARQVRPA